MKRDVSHHQLQTFGPFFCTALYRRLRREEQRMTAVSGCDRKAEEKKKQSWQENKHHPSTQRKKEQKP